MSLDNRITTTTRNRFVKPLFHTEDGEPPPVIVPDPPPADRKPYEQVEGERNRLRDEAARLKAERDELAAFKAEQEAATEAARQAALAEKGEYETLKAEADAKLAALQEENESFRATEKARRDAQAEANEAFLKDRTDADELRGKALRLVGDDPYKQAELLRELTAAAPGDTPPPTSGPSRDGGNNEPGEADLTSEDIAYLTSLGENTPEGRKQLAIRKAKYSAGVNASVDHQELMSGLKVEV
jgi:hypothetical protein